MNIGLFQLENLIYSQIRFCFLDVRENPQALPPGLEPLVARAVKIPGATVKDYLQKTLPSPADPVILLSDDGTQANRLRTTLESAGYTNIYVVEGGVVGLLSEL